MVLSPLVAFGRKGRVGYLENTSAATAAAADILQTHISILWDLYSEVISFADDAKEFAELSNKIDAALTCARDSASFDCNSVTKSDTFCEVLSDSRKIASSSFKIESSSLEFRFDPDVGVPCGGGEGDPDGSCASTESGNNNDSDSNIEAHLIPP